MFNRKAIKSIFFIFGVLFMVTVLASCSSGSSEIKLDTIPENGEVVYEKTIEDEEKKKELQSLLERLGDRKINKFSSWTGYRKLAFDFNGQFGAIYVKNDDGGALYIGEGRHFNLDEQTLDKFYTILELDEKEVEMQVSNKNTPPTITNR